MQSYFQSAVAFFTRLTIFRGVMVGPDGYFLGSFCPVASTFTFVPPTSITSTFGDFPVCAAFMAAPELLESSLTLFQGHEILEGSNAETKRIHKWGCRESGTVEFSSEQWPMRSHLLGRVTLTMGLSPAGHGFPSCPTSRCLSLVFMLLCFSSFNSAS